MIKALLVPEPSPKPPHRTNVPNASQLVVRGEVVRGEGHAVKNLATGKTGTYFVAEVARLRGFTPNTRILANSATKILNGVG